MMGGRRTVGTVLVAFAMLTACGAGLPPAHGAPIPPDPGVQLIKPGRGVFTFDGYAPLKSRPVRVWYDAPADPSTAQILIVMHGVKRNADEYLTDWHELAAAHNLLVLAPEFTEDAYPGADMYSLGNMVDEDGNPVPEQEWSFRVIEALFDVVRRDIGSGAANYALFGHSAGAQFVHRLVEFLPENRARVAVAANSGWYTMLDDSMPFPVGLKGAPLAQGMIGRAAGSNLVILLGADDIEQDDNLRRDNDVDAQGTNRLDRGLNFFRTARMRAAQESAAFRWRLVVVPGVAHSHQDMAPIAAPLLIDQPPR